MSLATTCNAITGNVTFEGKTTNEITLKEISYDTCNDAGLPTTTSMNGCDYLFTSNGEMHLKCPAGKKIEMIAPEIGCTISIGEQTLTGASYKTIGTPPNREITLSIAIFNIAATANNKCEAFGIKEGAVVGEYTTGNTILTAHTESGVMAEAWFE